MSRDEEILCRVDFLGSVADGSSSSAAKIHMEVYTNFRYEPEQDEGCKYRRIWLKKEDFSVDREELSPSTLCGILETAGVPTQQWLVTKILIDIGRKTSDDFYKNSKILRFQVRLGAPNELCKVPDRGYKESDLNYEMRLSAWRDMSNEADRVFNEDVLDYNDGHDCMDYDGSDDAMNYDDDEEDYPVLNHPIPATKPLIEGLKKLRLEEGCGKNCCLICSDEISVGPEEAILMPCSHLYHSCCIVNWLLRRSKFCPLCGSEVAYLSWASVKT